MIRYLDLRLSSPSPHSMGYFVPHSGVLRAVELVSSSLAALASGERYFAFVYLHGPSGVGKTHLINANSSLALDMGLSLESFESSELDEASFVRTYEQMRAGGGLLIVESAHIPSASSFSLHLSSRLLSACAVELFYPSEEEFMPIFLSLLERYDVRLSERCVRYMMRRLPLNPSVFASTISRLSSISFSRRRPVGLGVLRELLGGA